MIFLDSRISLEARPTCDPSLNSVHQKVQQNIFVRPFSRDNDAEAQITAFRAKNHDVSTF